MADETAVMDAGLDTSQVDATTTETTETTQTTDDVSRGTQDKTTDRVDNRRQPDAIRKGIAELKRQAEGIVDPAEKKAALDRIKLLYDTTGKARGYEEHFPTVREAREVRALLDAVGGRDGLTQMQSTLDSVAEIDALLTAGDASVIDRMWEEAPEGMPKLVPHILDRFAKEKPQEYQQFIAPKSIGYLDQSGFPQAFDRMVQAYEAGKLEDAKAIRDQLIQWVVGNRQQQQQQNRTDPEVERLRKELNELRQGGESQKVDQAYNAVVDHAGPAIDTAARPHIAKFGLTREEQSAFRSAVWDHLQSTRNANETYKTIAPAKQRQGYDAWTEYAKRWTQDNVEESVRAILRTPPWSRLTANGNGTKSVTKPVTAPSIQQGKEPQPSEIDYSGKGQMAARKAGFKDLADMLLSGQAPLKSGGIRKWR